MMTAHSFSFDEFASIVGPEHVRAATPSDAIDGAQPRVVVEPGDTEEVGGVLRLAKSAGARLAVRGGGTKIGWGNAPQGVDAILSTRRLSRVLEHAWDDMTATVEAGCRMAVFQEMLAVRGQCLPLDALWPESATVGGTLATNESGARRLRFGALRDLVIGITVVLADGTIARSGGKVVKNVAGYDLPKLFTGSWGTLGVITGATFRLYPLAREARTQTFACATTEAANQLMLAVHDSTLAPTGVQFRLRAEDAPPQVDVRFEGVAAAVEAQSEQLLRLAATAGDAKQVASSTEVWRAREELWEGAEGVAVCKFSVLPSRVGALCEAARDVASSFDVGCEVVAQSIGVGLLRLAGADEAVVSTIETLRRELQELGASLVVLRCPSAWKARIDVWGAGGDALPLMRRIKREFDPDGILNRGRFVGGI